LAAGRNRLRYPPGRFGSDLFTATGTLYFVTVAGFPASALFPLHDWTWPALAAVFVIAATAALRSPRSALRYGLADAHAVPVPLEVGMP
jgi:hypothetical protein